MPARAILSLVIDRSVLRGGLEAAVEAAVAGGVDWVQVRERGAGGEALAALTDRVRGAAERGAGRRGGEVKLFVNRRCDVALACRADGVHLGFDALPSREARRLLGPEALLGRSLHDAAEIDPEDGSSYVHLAPIFPPLSKASTRPALGLEGLRAACRRGIPVLAQGGVDSANAGAILEAGAAGIAVTGAILMEADPGAAAAGLRRRLDA